MQNEFLSVFIQLDTKQTIELYPLLIPIVIQETGFRVLPRNKWATKQEVKIVSKSETIFDENLLFCYSFFL